jgi:hypothetical protein
LARNIIIWEQLPWLNNYAFAKAMTDAIWKVKLTDIFGKKHHYMEQLSWLNNMHDFTSLITKNII